MRLLIPLIWITIFLSRAFAGDEGEVNKSPSGHYLVWSGGYIGGHEGYFEIRTKEGKSLFSSKEDTKDSLGTGGLVPNSHAEDVYWSPGEKFVMFTFFDGKYKTTAVYSFVDRKLISLGHVQDGYTVPVRWISASALVVENHWPMGGKARPQSRYLETYRVYTHPFHLKCTYKSPTTHEKEYDEDD